MSKKIVQNQWIPSLTAIGVGIAVWFFFERVISRFGITYSLSFWWAGYGIMLLVSGALGYLFNKRPWRWGIYIVLSHVTIASIRSSGDHNMLPLEAIFFAFLALLFVLAGYVGAWISLNFSPRRANHDPPSV